MSGNQAKIIGVLGRTGTGKSDTVKKLIKRTRKKRLVVWDFKREYPRDDKTIQAVSTVSDLVKTLRRKTFKVAFFPSMNSKIRALQFDLVCRAIYAVGDLVFVVEELKFVTRPGWAPEAWSLVTLTGRHEGLTVIGTSQRPASIDKDFFGNCTLIRCFSQTFPEDAAVIARAMSIKADQVQNLKTGWCWEYANGKAKKVNVWGRK